MIICPLPLKAQCSYLLHGFTICLSKGKPQGATFQWIGRKGKAQVDVQHFCTFLLSSTAPWVKGHLTTQPQFTISLNWVSGDCRDLKKNYRVQCLALEYCFNLEYSFKAETFAFFVAILENVESKGKVVTKPERQQNWNDKHAYFLENCLLSPLVSKQLFLVVLVEKRLWEASSMQSVCSTR